MTDAPRADKVVLALRVLRAYARVHAVTARRELPEAAQRLARVRRRARRSHPPARLSRGVDRVLRLGSWQPRCLIAALVLYRLLHEQGAPADLVIGLPRTTADRKAHAWVELSGHDIGPPPGRGTHEELARFGRSAFVSRVAPPPAASRR